MLGSELRIAGLVLGSAGRALVLKRGLPIRVRCCQMLAGL